MPAWWKRERSSRLLWLFTKVMHVPAVLPRSQSTMLQRVTLRPPTSVRRHSLA